MSDTAFTPPAVYAAPRVAADVLVWSDGARGNFITLVGKVAFRWQDGLVCALLDAPPIVVRERHRDRSPTKSLVTANELVPWLPRPEILLIGSAQSPGGRATPALTVQVSLSRGGAGFRKRVEVYGDRDARGARTPFRSMELTWERALRTDDNLVGVEPTQGAPNVIDPERPTRAAGFGPISSLWRSRQKRLGASSRPRLTAEPVALPTGFDGAYFQAAPEDQWLDELVGDEWLALDGLSPVLARVLTRLPGARLAAKVFAGHGRAPVELGLSPDRLALDADTQQGTLCYRAVLPMDHALVADGVVLVGIDADGHGMKWPTAGDPTARCPHLDALSTVPSSEPLVDAEERTVVREEPEDAVTLAERRPAPASDLPDFVEEDELMMRTTAMRPVVVHETADELDDEDHDLTIEHDEGEEPFHGTMALTAVRDVGQALPFDAPASPEEPDPEEEPFGGTMALRPGMKLGAALPFQTQDDEPDDTLGLDDAPEDEPFNETSAMRALTDVGEALPFSSHGDEAHDRADVAQQLVDEQRTVLPFAPESAGPVSDASVAPPSPMPQSAMPQSAEPPNAEPPNAVPQSAMPQSAEPPSVTPPSAMPPSVTPPSVAPPSVTQQSFEPPSVPASSGPMASAEALPFAPPSSPEAQRALLDDLHAAAMTPRKKGAFDDDEHTVFTTLPGAGEVLPFGPAGSPPPDAAPLPSAPPTFPRAAEPTGSRRRATTLMSGGQVVPAPDVTPPEPPARSSDNVPWISDQPVAVATVVWQVAPPQDSLTVIVKASFELQPDAPATLCGEAELPLGDIFTDDDPQSALTQASDFAILKTEVDVLVRGHAYAPRGRARVMQASLRIGDVDRSLAVIGDRVWQLAGHTEPEWFERMPIDYTRSFGGAGLPHNPVGVGHGRASDGVARLPNFELPSQLITSPRDTPPVASFGPVSPVWKSRWSCIGTYDAAWFDTRWPYFASDFDYRYFQAAPSEQRLRSLAGDESYELAGLHAQHERLRGTLAGLRARCYAQRTPEAGGEFVEIPVRADTVTFDTDSGLVHIVWRGVIDVRDDDASEIAQLFATLDTTHTQALAVADARARYLAALSKEPEVRIEPAPPAPAAPPVSEPRSEKLVSLDAQIAAMEAALAADLQSAEAAQAKKMRAPTNVEELAARVGSAGAADGEVAELIAAFAEERPAASKVDLRAFVQARMAEGKPLSNLDLRGADLSHLDLHNQCLAASDLTDANLESANLRGADLTDTNLTRASLVAVRGEGSLFGGADLSDVTMQRAVMVSATFDGATFSRVHAENADFREVSARRTSFVESILDEATFAGADLTACDLSSARLERTSFVSANLDQARLYDAQGERANFEAARMTGARAEGVKFARATFTAVRADGSVWERAELSGASFRKASLVDASFVRAICNKTIFAEGDLASGRLRKSVMRGAFFSGANLIDATCESADFSQADFRGANLHGTMFNKSSLRGANLDGAILSGSTIGRTRL